MPFIISDDQNEGSSDQDKISPVEKVPTNVGKNFVSGLPKAAAKLVAIPASRAFEALGGLIGGTAETLPSLIQSAYSFMGGEPPEWTEHPLPFRLTEEGKLNKYLRTPSEIRETATKPRFGEYTEPTNAIERGLSDISEIASNLKTSGIKGIKPVVSGALAAYGVRKGAEHYNVHPFFSIPAEMIATHTASSRSSPSLTKEASTKKGQELADTAMREGITKAPAAILSEGKNDWGSWFLRTFGKAGEKGREQYQQFVEEIENAYHNTLSTIHNPYLTQRNLVSLKKDAEQLFKPVTAMAIQNPVPITITNLMKNIDSNIDSLKRSKSLSTHEQPALTILEKLKKDIGTDPFTLSNGEATFRSFNKHIKDWDSPTKGETHLISVKEQLRRDLLDTGNQIPGFNEAFNMSNIAYHNVHNLIDTTEILKNSFTKTGRFDPQGFIDSMKNKSVRSELVDIMGKAAVDRMTKIALLTESAGKNFSKVGAIMPSDLQSFSKDISHKMGIGGSPLDLASHAILQSRASDILLNPNLQKNYLGYCKALINNSPKVAFYYLRNLKKDMESSEDQEEGFVIE